MLAVLGVLGLPSFAAAYELDLSVDMRAVAGSSSLSRPDGGLGKLRYDESHDGLRLGVARLGFRGDITPTLRVTAESVAYADRDVNPLDLTELYAQWRPIPKSLWRSSLKVGAFYPEISLENRMRGWRSPYTLTNSALNTWVGEELRTIGAQYSLDWLGRSHSRRFDIGVSAALFGWNDSAGTVLASRGWGLTDRQSTLFGRFANRGQPLSSLTVFYDEIDHRPGYHVAATVKYLGLLEAQLLHYDNRASLNATAPKINDTAWATFFDSLGLRWTPTADWSVISQWLHGRTYAGPDLPINAWSYDAEFLLASLKRGATRYSARLDHFSSQQTASNFYSTLDLFFGDSGHAWTLSSEHQFNSHWSVTVEAVQVASVVNQRALIGVPTQANERQWQAALRYER